MPTTAVKYPGTVSQSVTAGVDWANPDRVSASDDSRATTGTITLEASSETIYCTNFDFSEIPPAARIVRVYVDVEGNAVTAAANLSQSSVNLRVAGANAGSSFHNAGHPTAAVETVDTVNSTIAALGLNIYGDTVRLSTFGVGISYGGIADDDVISIDSVGMRIEWEPPGSFRTLGRSRNFRGR